MNVEFSGMAYVQRLKQVLSVIGKPAVYVGRSYNEVAQRYPFGTGVVTTVVKTSAADVFAQKVIIMDAESCDRHCRRCNHTAATQGSMLYVAVGDRKAGGD